MSNNENKVSNGDTDASGAEPRREDPDAFAQAKAIILQRRNAFMAAALAGAGLAMTDCVPSVCLSPAWEYDAGTDEEKDTGPAPCLSIDARPKTDLPVPRVCLSFEPPDAGRDAASDGGADAKTDTNTDGSST